MSAVAPALRVRRLIHVAGDRPVMGRIGYEGAAIRTSNRNHDSACLRSAADIIATESVLPPIGHSCSRALMIAGSSHANKDPFASNPDFWRK